MLYPNVLGQSGTASAAPVFVTSPPTRISTSVAAAVTSARRCVTAIPRPLSGAPPPFRCGGGDGAVHSSVVAFHGFSGALGPAKSDQKKLITNGSCERPRPMAPIVISTFHHCRGWRNSYCSGL